MPQFKVGDIVIYVNSNEKGVITEVSACEGSTII